MEEIIASNPDHVVVVDEAYVDFGAESCVPLIAKYPNLLVVQTFSKSRSMAGARLGFALGNAELIADLNRIKYSTNPYNVNRLTMAAGVAALEDQAYYNENCKKIMSTRAWTVDALEKLGFTVFPPRPTSSWRDMRPWMARPSTGNSRGAAFWCATSPPHVFKIITASPSEAPRRWRFWWTPCGRSWEAKRHENGIHSA